MSDYRVIAAVTATMQNLLTEAVKETVPGASVTLGPPRGYSSHEVAEGRISIFLYKVRPNMTWRNEELPYRRADGTLIRKPQLALDLQYLLSFYGDDNKHIPNLLLGAAMATLHAEPYPSPRYVPQTDGLEDDSRSHESTKVNLAGSGLLGQLQLLSFVWQPSEEQDVTHIWSTLFQVPYVISVAYVARVVLIEPAVVPQPVLPVREPRIGISSARQPRLDEIRPSFLAYASGASLELVGKNLDAEFVKVMVGELEASTVDRSAEALSILLPQAVQAGTNLVRVLHGRRSEAGEFHWDVMSNPVAFVLQPRVVDCVYTGQTPTGLKWGSSAVQQDLQIRFVPAVTSRTDVVLLLNESPPPPDRRPRSYALQGVVEPLKPDVLEVTGDVAPGRYLVRVQIRGVASPLSIDTDPASPTYQHYDAPHLAVPEASGGGKS